MGFWYRSLDAAEANNLSTLTWRASEHAAGSRRFCGVGVSIKHALLFYTIWWSRGR